MTYNRVGRLRRNLGLILETWLAWSGRTQGRALSTRAGNIINLYTIILPSRDLTCATASQ